MEQWKDVPGHEGSYQVSDAGRARSLDRVVTAQRENGPVDYRKRGRVLALVSDAYGYQQVNVAGKTWKVHRLVMASFVGPCPDGHEVRHLDGDKKNNRLTNLAYGTRRENMADRIRHGASGKGEQNNQAKLTADDVRAIRRSSATGVELAARFKVSRATISMIKSRKVWAHLPG